MQITSQMKALRPGVARIIEMHLPRSIEMLHGSPVSRRYADIILNSLKSPEAQFGYGSKAQAEALRRLSRAATEYERAISALPEGLKEKLHWAAGPRTIEAYALLYDVTLLTEEIKSGCKSLLRDQEKLPTAKANRDWKMAAIAGACREVWAIEEWRVNSQERGPEPVRNALLQEFYSAENQMLLERYRYHIQNFAPKSERQSPGPMGRMLEDLLSTIGGYEEGKSPSAQSALRSWKFAVDSSAEPNQ
ncbi:MULTISPECIES: hypothetical protein [unclassified Roseovarius]|uniref:hypothetical protein n=1 Tax=unclassified Roseovarius TaxID=2614913 RepID=UPI00273E1E57|nr:hypothetical protein [Roseovarius sp. MMSF_3350]